MLSGGSGGPVRVRSTMLKASGMKRTRLSVSDLRQKILVFLDSPHYSLLLEAEATAFA